MDIEHLSVFDVNVLDLSSNPSALAQQTLSPFCFIQGFRRKRRLGMVVHDF